MSSSWTNYRVFQKIWADLRAKPEDQNLRELAKFAKFVLQKFLAVAAANKKVFMELLFWKTARGTVLLDNLHRASTGL